MGGKVSQDHFICLPLVKCLITLPLPCPAPFKEGGTGQSSVKYINIQSFIQITAGSHANIVFDLFITVTFLGKRPLAFVCNETKRSTP